MRVYPLRCAPVEMTKLYVGMRGNGLGWWGGYRKMLGWKRPEIRRLRGITLKGEDLANKVLQNWFKIHLSTCKKTV